MAENETKKVAGLLSWEVGQEPSNIYWLGCCCCLFWSWYFQMYHTLKALKTIDSNYDNETPLIFLKAYIMLWGYLEAEFKIQEIEKAKGVTNTEPHWVLGLFIVPLGLIGMQRRINKLAEK